MVPLRIVFGNTRNKKSHKKLAHTNEGVGV